jgi:hypothetical protein
MFFGGFYEVKEVQYQVCVDFTKCQISIHLEHKNFKFEDDFPLIFSKYCKH